MSRKEKNREPIIVKKIIYFLGFLDFIEFLLLEQKNLLIGASYSIVIKGAHVLDPKELLLMWLF
jgi:hypothetical protein